MYRMSFVSIAGIAGLLSFCLHVLSNSTGTLTYILVHDHVFSHSMARVELETNEMFQLRYGNPMIAFEVFLKLSCPCI